MNHFSFQRKYKTQKIHQNSRFTETFHWSATLGEKPPKDPNEEPKVSPMVSKKCKEKSDFWKSEVVNFSSLTSLWEAAGSFCSGEKKTVSKIYLVFSVAQSHYSTHSLTSACHWATRTKPICNCWNTEKDRGEPRQTEKWSVIWSPLMLLSPSKPFFENARFSQIVSFKDKAKDIKSN